jgi:hypothetical protein
VGLRTCTGVSQGCSSSPRCITYSTIYTVYITVLIWVQIIPIPSATMATVRSRGSPADVSTPLLSYRARHGRVYGTRALHERTRAEQ